MYQAPKVINKLYQHIDLFSLTVHIIKHIENSEGEFINIECQIKYF